MAKAKDKDKEKEPCSPPAAETLKTVDPPDTPFPSQPSPSVEVENGANTPSTPQSYQVIEARDKYIEELRARLGQLEEENAQLKARVAELEGAQVQPAGDAPAATEPDHKALATQAYDLFRKSQAEGDFPAWAELPEQTQKLWRDSYQHVAAGGEPRTDYEEAVKYLIASAQNPLI
jgi:hypothetical protein